MANSKVTLETLCFGLVRDYFVSNGIKKSVDSINNCDIYLKKCFLNRQKYQIFLCKFCIFEKYHIQ